MANMKYQRQVNDEIVTRYGKVYCVKIYLRQSDDEIVEFEGKVYCVKTPWEPIADGKTFMAKAVEEFAEFEDGVFPAVGIEAFKNDDGSWDVIGVWDSERIDECGGGCGALVWSAEKGFQEVP